MIISTVLSLTCAISAASLPHGIHPHLSHMDALHSDQCFTFLKDSAPFSAFGTLDPTRMAVNEVLDTFKLIVSGQANNTCVLDFILTHENIPHLVIITGNPGVTERDPYPTRKKPLPI